MKDELLKSIVDKMVDKKLVDCWSENVTERSEDISIQVNPENDEDYAYSTDGIRYNKKVVYAYLAEKGYQMNQVNVDGAAKILSEQNDSITIPGSISSKTVKHHALEESDENEIFQYINYKIMEEINNLKTEILNQSVVEYSVEVVMDNSSGGTDIKRLSRVLQDYSSQGWKLKSLFTNELGVNSVSIGGIGTNATIDQVVLIFERPKIISNAMKTIINKK